MYEAYFNLKMKPFELLPNPEFLYLSRSHRKILSYLDYGIRERIGFILLTGEVGSGKTTVIRNLINQHIDNIVLSKVFNTRVDSTQLIAMINDDFGLQVRDLDKITLLRSLNSFLIQQFRMGRKPVLIIDEAQNLTSELLEEVRMLSNLETDSAKLLQIILVGQPELRQTLALPEMVQLRQRISINCHIDPLSRTETAEYIRHRLEIAGNKSAVTFRDDGIDVIYSCAKGIPRLINILCDFLMLSAFADGTDVITRSMVEDIVTELDFENHFWGGTTPSRGEATAELAATESVQRVSVETSEARTERAHPAPERPGPAAGPVHPSIGTNAGQLWARQRPILPKPKPVTATEPAIPAVDDKKVGFFRRLMNIKIF